MAVTKVLARDWGKAIYSGGGYVEINGIRSFTVATTKQDADTSDFESQGWNTHLVAARGTTITLEGLFLEDVSDKSRDPGQLAVEAQAAIVGPTGIAQYKLTTPGGTTWVFNASAEVTGPGGDTNAVADWKVTLTVSGSIVVT